MKVWITKYALTDGIFFREVEPPSADTPNLVVDRTRMHPQYFHGEGKDWHRTREGALAKAEKMRVAKLASLEKSMRKFQSLKFE